jgi:glycosyltransferase involved in cell wall biosynthesis
MKSPKVTAVITTFNRAAVLPRAINSVLMQSLQDIELLILDNSSKDDTERVVRNYDDARIRYVRHEPMNVSQARNLGVREARGQYVSFLDDDDEWFSDKLEAEVRVFEAGPKELGLVYCGFEIVDHRGMVMQMSIPNQRGWLYDLILQKRDALTGAASVPMIRRECYDAVGLYDPKLNVSEDDELYMRVAKRYMWDFVPEVLVRIHLHRGAKLGGRVADQLEAAMYRYALIRNELERYPRTKSSYLQQIGGLHCRLGKLGEGRRYIARAIKENPKNWAAWSQLGFSLLGRRGYRLGHAFYKKVLRKGYVV